MRVLVAGGDGFCGWPTALYLSAQGHEASIADNLSRHGWNLDPGTNYRAVNTRLIDLGLKPHLLTEETVERLLLAALESRGLLEPGTFAPRVDWRKPDYR